MMLHDQQQPQIMLQNEESKPKNFVNFSMEDRNGGGSTTDRSSASPSNIDELMEDDIVNQNHQKPTNSTSNEKDEEDRRFLYLQHQISRIMRHLKVEPCSCENCSEVENSQKMRQMLNDPSAMLSHLFPNASDQQIQTLLELSKINQLPSQVTPTSIPPPSSSFLPVATQPQQQQQQLGSGYAANANAGGKMVTTPTIQQSNDKKFGVPPYFPRKDSVTSSSSNIVVQPGPANSATVSPGPSSDGGSDEHEISQNDQQHHVQNTPNMFTQSMVDMLKMNANAAHSTGSPGFLRGRGRGRPKLIGDELDADLVDYMVQVKQNDCHGHLTASQALHIAKQYILERAPGLLEEHGGHVKLKLTWAMKLVSRIAERQKEIEYGLPAGTLSNMGRTLGTLPGNNFMADVVAQNLLSQHMMMVNQMNNGVTTTNSNGGQIPTENRQPVTGMMVKEENGLAPSQADIVNIKELNLPIFNTFLHTE